MNLKNVNTRVIFNTPLNNVQLSKDTKEQNTKLNKNYANEFELD